ncbi:MAG TPA: glycosyltransferase family 9 protein, partial [Candidatus Limnocylindrales bacterium]|nr:glycosyltransferase family 9 protein [Candidatus Limnocylindrales bacterium]
MGGRLTVLEAGDRPLWSAAPQAAGPVPRPMLATGASRGWSSFGRILCVRLDAIGDVLMTTPAIRALKAARPDRHVALLTSTAGATAGGLLPEVDEVLVHDPPWMKATPERDGPDADRALIEVLAAGGYDAAVIFTVQSQPALPAALLVYLAGIPRRLGHSRENPYQLLTEWLPEPEPDEPVRHEVRRQLDLVAAVGIETADERLSLRVPADASRRVRDRLGRLGIDVRRPWLLVHPGSTAPSRTYPAPFWAAAVREIAAATDWPVVWSGGPNERSFV